MRPLSPITLSLSLLVVSACSPACNAPAVSPDGAPAKQAPKDDAPSERDKARANLPKEEEIREAKGVALDALSDSQRETFFQLVNSEPSACGQAHSIARSLRDDAKCRDSVIVAQFIADALAAGANTSAIRDALEFVVKSLTPQEIDNAGRPVYGSPNAPVTVVEFADFTCPHCQAEAPLLREAIDSFRGRAKLVYRYFPLEGPGHDRSRPAALAAEAAHEQGKFWEMHDLLFAAKGELEDDDIYGYAQKVGLDMAKFKASYTAKKGESQLDTDRALGEKLGISGTPALFVNGRMLNELLFGGTVTGWIDDALKR